MKQEPQKTKPTANSSPTPSIPSLSPDIVKQAFADMLGKDSRTGQLNALNVAVQTQQTQEKHDADMQAAMLKQSMIKKQMDSEDLKNEETRQRIQIQSAKAQAEGLATQAQDPVPQEPPKTVPSTALQDAIKQAKEQLAAQSALEAKYGNTSSQAIIDNLVQQFQESIDRASKKKTLANSEAGPFGMLLGGVLNLASRVATLGTFNLGTELFGGTPNDQKKSEMLGRALYTLGPLYRSELDFAINQQRQYTLSAKDRLRYGNIDTSLAGPEDDARSVDDIINTKFDIMKGLSTEFGNDIGGGATSGFQEMFGSWENLNVMLQGVREAPDPTTLQERSAQYDQHYAVFKQAVAAWMQQHGEAGAEELIAKIGQMQDHIDKTYLEPISVLPGETKETLRFKSRKKATALSFRDNLKGGPTNYEHSFLTMALHAIEELQLPSRIKAEKAEARRRQVLKDRQKLPSWIKDMEVDHAKGASSSPF